MRFRIRTSVCIMTSVFLLGGCANNQIAETERVEAKAAHAAIKRALTPKEAIAKAEQNIAKAEQENFAFFAPTHLQQAQEALLLAKQLEQSPDPKRPNGVIEESLAASHYIELGLKNKDDVLLYLKEAIAHKRVLQSLDVPDRFTEEYNLILNDFATLIRMIERGNAEQALNQQKPMRLAMTELEIKALKDEHLSYAQKLLDEADALDADRYAPKSFEKAQQKFRIANQYIEQHFRDRKGIHQQGLDATSLAQLALEVCIESKRIMTMDSQESEKYVLAIQDKLSSFSRSLGQKGHPAQSLEKSYQQVSQEIVALRGEQAKTIQALEAANLELARYDDIELIGMQAAPAAGVKVIEVMQSQDVPDPSNPVPAEQSFDDIQFME